MSAREMTDREILVAVLAEAATLRRQMNLLFTALENVKVLSAVRDENGDVTGLNAEIVAPMIESKVR